jgi:hypothetical protein
MQHSRLWVLFFSSINARNRIKSSGVASGLLKKRGGGDGFFSFLTKENAFLWQRAIENHFHPCYNRDKHGRIPDVRL